MNHTPTPWRAVESADFNDRIETVDGYIDICEMASSTPEDSRNARHIVRCVNYHDEMVRMLQRMQDVLRFCTQSDREIWADRVSELLRKMDGDSK